MVFYLIGLGLDKKSISADALKVLKSCDEVYLENYTVDFPYSIEELEGELIIEIKELDRLKVEDESIIDEAKEKNIALLVYGDALSATTHMQLILACKKQNIDYKIFHNASIMTAVSQTGLSPYKFGKTASMPNWEEHINKPTSFINYIDENQSINAHTLLLIDIDLSLNKAIEQLKIVSQENNITLPDKIIILSNAGTKNQRILYDTIKNLKKKRISMPFCMIIPGDLHFVEEEALNKLTQP